MSSKGYEVYIDGLLLPLAPSKIEVKINNQNKTISLVNGEELNLINAPGLTDISMDILLPSWNYPFLITYQKQEVYLNKFEDLKKLDDKEKKKTFPLVILRSVTRKDLVDSSFSRVTIEDYKINEDSKNGNDLSLSLSFKQYKLPNMKKLKVTENKDGNLNVTMESQKDTNRKLPISHTVVKGDCLWTLCKKYLGSVSLSKCWDIAKKNGISNPNIIKPGQVIKFE